MDVDRARDANTESHDVIAVPVSKMDGIVAWRFTCSCGRQGNGWHRTPEKAIEAGKDHIRA